jgi:hypothetical protein
MLRLLTPRSFRIRAVAVALAVALVPGALPAASLPEPFGTPRSSRFT